MHKKTNIKKSHAAYLMTLLLSLHVLPANSKDGATYQKPDGWRFSLGAAAILSPMFEGSGNYGLSIFPDMRVAYGDKFFASIPEGVGYNFSNSRVWRYGPLVKLRFSRKEDAGDSPFHISGDTNELKGLGKISAAGETGGFVSYRTKKLKYKLEVRQGFGGHEGMIGNLKVSTFGSVGKFRYDFGPDIEYASSDYVNTYFGVNATQASSSGLSQYSPSGGITHVGIGGVLLRPLNKKVMMTVFANYKRLLNAVVDSPIVKQGSENQFMLGVGASYTF